MAKTDCGKGTFDRIRRSDVTPVLSGEVIECQQLIAVFLQAVVGFVVLRAVGFQGLSGIMCQAEFAEVFVFS